MIIKTEEFDKDGVTMIKEYIGPNKDTITGIVEYAKPASTYEMDAKPDFKAAATPPELSMTEKLMSQLLLNQATIVQRLNTLEEGHNV